MKLLEKFSIGNLSLKNRMVMAPMTRSRADANGVVSDLTVTYYQQRASAGLIVSEGINISKQATGSPFTPGLYTKEQIAGWKKVTDAVHKEGGVIFAQLWHTGRVGHSIDRDGQLPVSASAIAIEGQQHFTSQGQKPYEIPKALSTAEVKDIVQHYTQAGINAMEAGFDGVELHGAFGYLPNQFLVESANHRTDEYGGSIANRTRFVVEIMEALVAALGAGKAGVRLSPSIPFNSIMDSNPEALFGYLIERLNILPLAYIHLMQPLFPVETFPQLPKDVLATFGHLTGLPLIVNGGYNREKAESEITNNRAQMVAFGAAFLANPDLPERFAQNALLNAPDKDTFYGGGAKGYIDYPALAS